MLNYERFVSRFSVDPPPPPLIFLSLQYAAKSVAAFCHLQKPPRVYVEKSVEEIFRENGRTAPVKVGAPGNRDDNRWLTFSDPPFSDTQSDWEERCFLDRLAAGYYQWPKTIKYVVNKRERYTQEQMPNDVAIVFQRFRDQSFVNRLIEQLVLDDDETESNRVRFLMFKVCSPASLSLLHGRFFFRVSFEISAWPLSISFSINCTC